MLSISVSATVFKLITLVSLDNVNQKLIANLKESSNTVFKHLKLRILTQILLKKHSNQTGPKVPNNKNLSPSLAGLALP